MKAWSIYEPSTILKMNFNFNFKDKPGSAEASIRYVTNVRDLHHAGKIWIKRNSRAVDVVIVKILQLPRSPQASGGGSERRQFRLVFRSSIPSYKVQAV
jgi:hypothetical protein